MAVLKRFKSSLTFSIAAVLVLVTVVPVAFVGYSLAAYNKEHLTTLEKQSLTREAVNLASEVSMYVAGQHTRLHGITRALKAVAGTTTKIQSEILYETAEDSNRAFLYLQVADSSGDGAFVRDPGLSDAAATSLATTLADAFRTGLENEEFFSIRVDLPENGSSVTVFGLPIENRDGSVEGSLTAVLDLAPIQERLQASATGGQIVTLFSESGQIIAGSRTDSRGKDISASPLVKDFTKTPVRLTRIYQDPQNPKNHPVVGSVAGVADTPWGILVERSTADSFAPVRGMQVRTIIVSGLAGLIALAVGFLLARRLTVPILELDRVSSEIAQGNLAVRAPVTGSDEIAHLAGNFNNMAGSIENLVRRLRQAIRQNQELFLETIRTLAAAIDAKDPYTRGHSDRVSSYSLAIARHLDLSQDEVFQIRIAAILHDVGKLGIRDGILNKPGGLTEEEFTVMRQHPEIGAQIMAPIRMLKDIIPGIRNHHETWDGKGYPDGLKGEDIPLVARIIGAADTFDAMTTTRPYQKAMSLDFVLGKMHNMSGTRFAPKVITALLAAVEADDITPPDSKHGGPAPTVEVS
ncbi:MAG: HD domain-containing protein [Thermoanaerobaculales bacterium]|nr:HD domain-containing protein [Thermoanaerobaculales bacterium]